ncbi:MAG: hypothetical protein ITG01_02315 [Comamonas sp.]|nr:hypothetical protein [Comamonas sp.]
MFLDTYIFNKKVSNPTPRAQASRPNHVEVPHFSGGCLSEALQARSEFRRTASQTRFLVPFCRAQKGTRPPGRNPASAKNHPAKAQNKQKNSYYPR